MTAPNPKRQKAGLAVLDQLVQDAANCWIIHYSCESFYDRPEGTSPRITSVAVRKIDTAQTLSFSIHQIAEEQGIPMVEIEEHYDDLEEEMLNRFFQHVGAHQGMKYVHWNMRDVNFGFAAIEHRYRVLGGEPTIIGDDRKIDLARLLVDIYGVGYAAHPRLESLLKLNSMHPPNFMSGAQEAAAFEGGNYVGLHQSTLSKVDVINNLLARAQDRQLKTNTSWWEMHGGRFRTFLAWIAANPLFAVLAGLASIVGLAFAISAVW